MEDLANTKNQLDVIDNVGKLCPTSSGTTFFSRDYKVYQYWPHAGHKASPNTRRRTEVTQNTFSNHSAIKLEISNKRITEIHEIYECSH